jgi:hypothetical protein
VAVSVLDYVILSLLLILVLVHYSICFSKYWWPQLQIVPFHATETMQKLDVKPGDLILSRWSETSNPWARVPWWHHVALVFRDASGIIQVADFRPIPEQDPIFGTMQQHRTHQYREESCWGLSFPKSSVCI